MSTSSTHDVHELLNLTGHTALVTGASGNIGQGVARWLARAPMEGLGTPNDVADAVLFLLSPAARWISGANLIVDGGMSAQSKW